MEILTMEELLNSINYIQILYIITFILKLILIFLLILYFTFLMKNFILLIHLLFRYPLIN